MNQSPLRYPGGKSKIAPLVGLIIRKLNFESATYIEPFAGGAGVAISLLLDGVVDKIVINDYDKAIYSFWRALKEESNALIELIQNTPVTVEEWYRQKEIFTNSNHKHSLELGFATFFLNRTNRSGILSAGPIGGYDQKGNYLINARYNKTALIERIRAIANRRKNIFVYNKEARNFITQVIPQHQDNAFVYFDPPYYHKGKELYKNFFNADDHRDIAECITDNVVCNWIITYDDAQQIRDIYPQYIIKQFNLNYSVANKRKGLELMIFKNADVCPTAEEIAQSGISFELVDAEGL